MLFTGLVEVLNNVAIAVFPDPEIDTPETIVFHDSEYAAITATGLYPAISGTSASANVPLFAAAEYFVVRVRDITIPDIKFPFFSRIKAVHMSLKDSGTYEWLLSCHFLSRKEALPMG